jgi:Fe-S-cluster containining protein
MNEAPEPIAPASVLIDGWLIDASLLEKKSIRRCRIQACKGGCCADGVWVSMPQARAIMDRGALIAPFMPAERRDSTTWFAEPYNDEHAFPPGEYIGTTTVVDASHPSGTTCVFLRPEDRFCAIQAASLAHDLPAWSLKPFYCCLFPLVDERSDDGQTRKLMLDAENDLFERGGGCHETCADEQYVFQVYAEEMVMAIGRDRYHALCQRVGVPPRL